MGNSYEQAYVHLKSQKASGQLFFYRTEDVYVSSNLEGATLRRPWGYASLFELLLYAQYYVSRLTDLLRVVGSA